MYYQTCQSFSFSLQTSTTYNSSNGLIRFYQNSLSPMKYNGYFGNFTFLLYKTTNSTQPVGPITFRIMRAGSAKMRGTTYFTPDAKVYPITVTNNDSNINIDSQYTINVNITDGLDRSGYIILGLPTQLVIGSGGISISLYSNTSLINTSPKITSINSSNYLYNISNLNLSSTQSIIPTQYLTITISNIINPSQSLILSSFTLTFYYSYLNYQTATSLQPNNIQIIPGNITNATVNSDISITYTPAIFTLLFTITNKINVNGYIYISLAK